MSVYYKCYFCNWRQKKPMAEMKIRTNRETPGVLEGEACYINDHVCDSCKSFYEAYVKQAEYEAFYILRRTEDPVADLIKSQQEEMPTNCDGAWNFIVPYDDFSNEILDARRVIWQEGIDSPMTVGEVVKYLMQKEKEAAANADELTNESEVN